MEVVLLSTQNAPYGQVDMSPSTPMSKETRNEILKVSSILGLCLLLFYALGEFSGRLLANLVNAGTLPYTFTVQQIVQILYTVTTILLPFAIGAYFIKKVQRRKKLLLFDKPSSGILLVEAVGIGLIAIVAANFITAFLVQIFEGMGFTFDSYKPESPQGGYQLAWMLLSNAIVPALVEEFALRGVMLQALRKYGDAFAVFASALLFGIMHGNMTQAPFAFLLGAVLAILVIMTGSLWTAMIVHLINNTYSVLMTMVLDSGNDLLTSMVTVSVNTLFAIYGSIAIVYFFGLHHGMDGLRARFRPGGPARQGVRVYRQQAWLYTIISPAMLVALIFLLVELFKSVHYGG